ncbi:MAG: peptidase M42 [Pseudomonadota bacterium]|nr:peptidase M42 [Pseudomonadota bacterium]
MNSLLPSSFVELLSLLMREPSVVGAEHTFFRVLQRELEERGAKVTWYEGLLVAQGSDPHSIMLSAHIDRHGLICTGPNEFQYAAFVAGARSDLLGNSVSEQLMKKIEGRFVNAPVFAYEPWTGAYRGRGHIKGSEICEFRNNLIFELEGLEHVVAGTPIAMVDKLKVTEDALVGQLDNVLSAAVMIYLFELGFTGTAFFTAQEEAGKSWRYLLEWFRRFGGSTNQLFVLDTSPMPDFAAASAHHLVLRHEDANAKFNEALTTKLATTCETLGYRYLYKDDYVRELNKERIANGESEHSLGSTELGRIVAASQGLVDGTTLQVPSSGYHTMQETAPQASVKAFIDVLCELSNINAPQTQV